MALPAGGPLPVGSRRCGLRQTAATVAALVACLALTVTAAVNVYAGLTRKPTTAELSQAAAAAVASRWQAWPVGKVFPATLQFTADLDVTERATRAGIDHAPGCAAAVDPPLGPVLLRNGCRGVLRASYLDQRQAVVFTIGVVALPTERAAAVANSQISVSPRSGLRALAIAGTPSAWFSDDARQAATATSSGPYLVLTTAGYADGRPAAETAEQRPSVFAPAGQLANAILAALVEPAVPRCGTPGWTC